MIFLHLSSPWRTQVSLDSGEPVKSMAKPCTYGSRLCEFLRGKNTNGMTVLGIVKGYKT